MGSALRQTNVQLQELEKLVVSVYGPQAQVAFSFRMAIESLERLQRDLENQATSDLPGYITGGFYL